MTTPVTVGRTVTAFVDTRGAASRTVTGRYLVASEHRRELVDPTGAVLAALNLVTLQAHGPDRLVVTGYDPAGEHTAWTVTTAP